jgi:Mg2+-importing ATPase
MLRGESGGRWGNWIVWLVGAALLGAVVSFVAHFAEEHAFTRLLQQARPRWLLVAVVLQSATYLAEADVWRAGTGASAARVSLGKLYRLSIAKLFVDQAIPSGGLSGTLLYVEALRRAGVARAAALSGVVVATFSYYMSYVACLGVALVMGLGTHAIKLPVVVAAVAFIGVSTALSAFVFQQAGRTESGGVVRRLEIKIPFIGRALGLLRDADPALTRNPRVLKRAFAAQIAIVLLDAATVWVCLLAVGAAPAPTSVYVGYMFSSLFRTLSVVPGGLGAFEAASTYMLHIGGTSVEAALSATLLFRGFSFWLPMLPGLLFARQAAAGSIVTRAGA